MQSRNRFGLLTLAVAASVVLSSALDVFAPTPNVALAKPASNFNSPLGTNLSIMRAYSSEYTFVDAFKDSRTWLTQCTPNAPSASPNCTFTNSFDTGEESSLNLDANDWVISLPVSGSPLTYRSVGTLMFNNYTHFPAGQYLVQYDGEGTTNYGFGATRVSSTPGRDVVNVTPSVGAFYLYITATDPNHTGNYIRNIRVIMPGFESNYASQIFHPDFLNKIAQFKVLRFKDWIDTDGSIQPGDWASRPHVTDAHWTTGNGVPVETMVALANRTSADAWFSMPHRATDDYITQFATLVRDTLTLPQKAYVEYSNEVWNNAFPFSIQANWVEQQGIAMWSSSSASNFTKRVNWFGLRTAQICDIWKQVWGAQSNRVICVMSAFSATAWVGAQALDCPLWTQGAPCSAHGIGALAIAPYFGIMLDNPASNRTTVTSWLSDSDGGLTKLFAEILSGGLLTNDHGGPLQAAYTEIDNNFAVANQRHVPLITYEGGQSLVDYQYSSSNTAITNLFETANRDARMGTVYDQYLAQWRAHGGQLFVHFNNVGAYGQYGSWGLLEYLDQTGSPKFSSAMNFINNNPCWWLNCSTPQSNQMFLPLITR